MQLHLLAPLVLAACASQAVPAAAPTLSELPTDRAKREEILTTASERRQPEGKRGRADPLYKVETAAATAAAVLGVLFSRSPNAVVGLGTPFDENRILDADAAAGQPKRADERAPAPDALHACPGRLLLQTAPCPDPPPAAP